MRLFVAVPVPSALAERAAALLPPSLPGLRAVRPELMHLTLAFLGATADERLPDAIAATAAAARGRAPFEIALDRPGRFPPTGRPRAVWLGVGPGAAELAALAAAVATALRERDLRSDDRPFAAHLTLGRVREAASAAEARAVAGAVAALRPPELRFGVDRIALVESTLFRDGPRYTERASTALGA